MDYLETVKKEIAVFERRLQELKNEKERIELEKISVTQKLFSAVCGVVEEVIGHDEVEVVQDHRWGHTMYLGIKFGTDDEYGTFRRAIFPEQYDGDGNYRPEWGDE